MGSNPKTLSPSNSIYPQGCWVNLAKITEIEYPENKFKSDIALLCILSVEHSKYPKKLWLSGNHLFDEKGNFEDYGKRANGVEKFGSWRLGHLFDTLGIEKSAGLTQDGSKLNSGVEEMMIGIPFYILEYESNGAAKRSVWRFFAKHSEGKMKLINDWKNQDAKFIPKDYVHAGGGRLEDIYNEIDDGKEPWEK